MTIPQDDDERIVTLLRAAGVSVRGIWQLVDSQSDYPEAVPALLRGLDEVTDRKVREGIIRALAVPSARSPEVARALIREFEKEKESVDDPFTLKWVIGNTLSVVGVEEVFDDLARLACDPRNHRDREMIVLGLGNMPPQRAGPVLLRLLDDNQVVGHAIEAIGKLRLAEAVPKLQQLTRHEKSWIRKEAKKALTRIAKAKKPR